MNPSPTTAVCRAIHLFAVTAVLGSLAALSGCNVSTSDRDIVWIEPSQVRGVMDDRTGIFGMGGVPDGVYLDPRTEAAFLRGRIPGATNVPLPEIDATFPSLRSRTVIVVYDSDFSDVMARAASKRLIELGHRNVRTIRGGLRAWERDGNPVETGPVADPAAVAPPQPNQ